VTGFLVVNNCAQGTTDLHSFRKSDTYLQNEKSPNKSIWENGVAGLLTLLHSGILRRIIGTFNGTTLDFFVKENLLLEESFHVPACAWKQQEGLPMARKIPPPY
jgi:hypothetical protein